MEYYSAVKNNDFRKFEHKLIEAEKKTILSEVTQTEKDKHGNSRKWILAVNSRTTML